MNFLSKIAQAVRNYFATMWDEEANRRFPREVAVTSSTHTPQTVEQKADEALQKIAEAANLQAPAPARDLTKERNDRCVPMAEKMLKLMLENNVRTNEISYIYQLVLDSLDKSFEVANIRLWNKPKDEITMKDLDELLKK